MDTRTAGLSDFLSSMLVPLMLASVDVVVLSVVVGLFLCGLLDVECVDVAAVLSVEVTAFGIVVVVVAVVVVVVRRRTLAPEAATRWTRTARRGGKGTPGQAGRGCCALLIEILGL